MTEEDFDNLPDCTINEGFEYIVGSSMSAPIVSKVPVTKPIKKVRRMPTTTFGKWFERVFN